MTNSPATSRGIFGYACGALAGVVSAFVVAFALSHAGSVLVLSSYIATIPLFMAGFGIGFGPGLVAALCGAAGLFALMPPSFGMFYMVSDALPAIGLIFLGMRRRSGADGKVEWSAEGNLLAALAIYPAIIFIAAFIATLGHDGGLLAMTTDLFDGMSDQVGAMLAQNGEKVTPETTLQVRQSLEMMARIAPALAMCTWLFSTLVAMAVAQGILKQQNWARRPSFSLIQLHVPNWVIYAAAITGVVGSFAPAPYGYLGLNLAIVLGVPFFFTGLAVIHAWAGQKRWPTLILVAFYVVICLVIYLVLFVALLGAVDQWVDFRKRFAAKALTQRKP